MLTNYIPTGICNLSRNSDCGRSRRKPGGCAGYRLWKDAGERPRWSGGRRMTSAVIGEIGGDRGDEVG